MPTVFKQDVFEEGENDIDEALLDGLSDDEVTDVEEDAPSGEKPDDPADTDDDFDDEAAESLLEEDVEDVDYDSFDDEDHL